MTYPIMNQPSFESSRQNANEFYFDSYNNSVAPSGPPVILEPIVALSPASRIFGPQPTFVTCHLCNLEVKTVIFNRPTAKTHVLACCLCIFGCWPCMCIPYCLHSYNKTDHYCPYCSAFIGSYVMPGF